MEAWISGWTKKCEASKLLGDVSMDEKHISQTAKKKQLRSAVNLKPTMIFDLVVLCQR